jgi:hypothetical protein
MGKKHLLVVFGVVLALSGAVGAAGPFQQVSTDGLVVMEAEDFTANVPQGGKTFELATDWAGFSGTGAMQSLPNSGTNNNTGYVTGSPHLDFQIKFTKTGVHYVWVRGFAHGSGSDDSAHAGLDGQVVDTADRINFNSAADWVWTGTDMDGGRVTINVPSVGLHTLNLYMREDGCEFDKVILTTNSAYTPTGMGPTKKASGPLLADGAAGVLSPLMTWSSGFTALWHDVYFGTSPELGQADLRGRQPLMQAMYWHLPGVEPGKTYYWRIDEVQADGAVIPGDVWSFTAAPVTAYMPMPADGASTRTSMSIWPGWADRTQYA